MKLDSRIQLENVTLKLKIEEIGKIVADALGLPPHTDPENIRISVGMLRDAYKETLLQLTSNA